MQSTIPGSYYFNGPGLTGYLYDGFSWLYKVSRFVKVLSAHFQADRMRRMCCIYIG